MTETLWVRDAERTTETLSDANQEIPAEKTRSTSNRDGLSPPGDPEATPAVP